MRSGEEIQAALRAFVGQWQTYDGSERAEAQTFLNELFARYGTDRRVVAEFEKAKISLGFMDLLWPDVCIVEMKAPKEADTLEKHRPQVFGYWQNSSDPATGRAVPPYFVLCAFRRFEVWEPGNGSDATNVFAFDDDYSMGVLSSSTHGAWACSRYADVKCYIVSRTRRWPRPTSGRRTSHRTRTRSSAASWRPTVRSRPAPDRTTPSAPRPGSSQERSICNARRP